MLLRRLITIPGYAIGWALWLVAVPVWLPVTKREARIASLREEWQRVETWVTSHPSSGWK